MAHMRLWASPIALENMDTGCDLLKQKLRETVGISKFQFQVLSQKKNVCTDFD